MVKSADDLMDDNLILPDPRPTRADAVKNRELLLETAQRLFAQNGVDAVTMSEVAESAGVGKGTLYRHFANKVELCHMLIDEDQRDFQNRALTRLRAGGSPLANLEWFLREVIAFLQRNDAFLSTELASVMVLGHPAHNWWRQTIRGLLMQINPRIDIEYSTDVVFVMLDPRTIRYQKRTRGCADESIISGLIGVLHRLTA
jgi:AcrR family transcriptional regulator